MVGEWSDGGQVPIWAISFAASSIDEVLNLVCLTSLVLNVLCLESICLLADFVAEREKGYGGLFGD